MSDLIDISTKSRVALIQGRENDEPINQVHSTTYVEDFDNISVAKSKKKILLGAYLCSNENKIGATIPLHMF
jgi:predicted metal-dependent hydrolase